MSTDPLQALLTEVEKVEKRRIKKSLTWEALAGVIKDTLNGGTPAVEDNYDPIPKIPVMLPDWPKVKVRYGGGAQEWIVVNSPTEEVPYQSGGWYTEWPPNALRQVQGQVESLESCIERLKAAGIKERPREEWQRRKQGGVNG